MEENKKRKVKLSTILLTVFVILITLAMGTYAIVGIIRNNIYSLKEQENGNKVDSGSVLNDIKNISVGKPIIYIYPEKEEKISIKLGYPQKFTCIYPKYHNGWTVIAKPDGRLIDEKTGREYYSLYYESENTKAYDGNLKEGFVIHKENIVSFLEEKLAILGLNEREAEEFIIYWLPQLQQHKYIYIRFQTMEEIEENMPLIISKTPDTLIRIIMEWKGLNEYMEVKKQELTPVTRKGFTVVEWGGTIIK